MSSLRVSASARRISNAVLLIVILCSIAFYRDPSFAGEYRMQVLRGGGRFGKTAFVIAQDRARELNHKYLPGAAARVQLDGEPGGMLEHSGPVSSASNFTTTIVLGRLKSEENQVKWLDKLHNMNQKFVYIVDDPTTSLPHLAKNHGREAAVYLTYIVQEYDRLNEITFFWHSQRVTWHNNLMMNWDSVEQINRMDRRNVMREGYVPSRCDHWPGCPSWIKFNPSAAENRLDPHRLEEMFTPELFARLFPDEKAIPPYFAGTCCSQFAVSRDTIRAHPLEYYQRLLDWILEYEYDDRSGRMLEYTWPYIFLGRGTLCPSMQECYCKTYNFCMEDRSDVRALVRWNAMRTRREEVQWQLNFVKNMISGKEDGAQKQSVVDDEVTTPYKYLKPEYDRLSGELARLANDTWQAREDIIHRWSLDVPPVGW